MPRGGAAEKTRAHNEFHWPGPAAGPQAEGSQTESRGDDQRLPPDHTGMCYCTLRVLILCTF